MLKFLLVLFVIWVLARLAKRWLLAKALRMQQDMAEQLRAQMHQQMGQQMGQQAAAGQTQSPAQADGGGERMVACAHCGLHIPQSEALLRAGQPYCSLAHADQAQA